MLVGWSTAPTEGERTSGASGEPDQSGKADSTPHVRLAQGCACLCAKESLSLQTALLSGLFPAL